RKTLPNYFDTFSPIARKTTAWPSIISRHWKIEEMNKEIIEKLNLGADVNLNMDGGWDLDAPEFRAALWLIQMLEGFKRAQSVEAIKNRKKAFARINQLQRRPKNYQPPPPFKLSPEMQKDSDLRMQSVRMA